MHLRVFVCSTCYHYSAVQCELKRHVSRKKCHGAEILTVDAEVPRPSSSSPVPVPVPRTRPGPKPVDPTAALHGRYRAFDDSLNDNEPDEATSTHVRLQLLYSLYENNPRIFHEIFGRREPLQLTYLFRLLWGARAPRQFQSIVRNNSRTLYIVSSHGIGENEGLVTCDTFSATRDMYRYILKYVLVFFNTFRAIVEFPAEDMVIYPIAAELRRLMVPLARWLWPSIQQGQRVYDHIMSAPEPLPDTWYRAELAKYRDLIACMHDEIQHLPGIPRVH